MGFKVKQILSAALSLLLSFGSVDVALAADRTQVDAKLAMVAGLVGCKNSSELDCIEGVSVISDQGNSLNAKQISASTDSETDDKNQVIETGESIWEYTTSSGTTNQISIKATITTPTFIVDGSLDQVEVVTGAEEEIDDEQEDSNTTTEVVESDTRYFEPKLTASAEFPNRKLQTGEQLQIKLRTSWLELEEAYLSGKNSTVKLTQTANGKNIVLSGSEVAIHYLEKSRNRLTGKVTEIIRTKENLEFTLLHPKQTNEVTACYRNGFPTFATNGSSLSSITAPSKTTLSLVVSGYKSKPDNTPNLGFVVMNLPIAWIKCKYPDSDLPLGTNLKVGISKEEGKGGGQTVSYKAIVAKDVLEINTEGFILGKTEITIAADTSEILAKKAEVEAKAKAEKEKAEKAEKDRVEREKAEAEAKAKAEAEAAKSTTKAETKKVTITCVKGKIAKKVTELKPKCPKGYKKK